MNGCVCTAGRVEVIAGPVCAGKSDELLRRISRARIAGLSVYVFAPQRGRFKDSELIQSRTGARVEARKVAEASDVVSMIPSRGPAVVAFDEAQWFDGLEEVVSLLAGKGFIVIVTGLDQDYEGKPYLPMCMCMGIAESVLKLTAVSKRCGCEATHTARLGDKVGCSGEWEPMCRNMWQKFREGLL